MLIPEAIFREYDIRGLADTELTDEIVTKITAAAALVFIRAGKKRIAVGMDGRPSSERIRRTVLTTLTRYGLDAVDVGLVPTPVVYFTVFYWHLDGAVIITASHNPGEFNGFKMMVGQAALFGDGIRELYQIASRGELPVEKPGRIDTRDALPDYFSYIVGNVKLDKPGKVVVDCGNGTGGITAGPLYRRLGAEVIELYAEVDGTFPNHHPDPTQPKNLQALIARVRETGADLGIGLDGDADRIGVVDHEGNILLGDQILLIFARDVLQRLPGSKIISEVKASEVLYQDIRDHGGVPIMWKTGHSLIKQKIQDEGAPLAGEVSGHIFFNDKWFGFDDAVYAGARLLEILSRQGVRLHDIWLTIPKVCNTPEIRVDTTDAAKFRIVEIVRDHFCRTHQVIDLDGARIKFPHGWALVRASNTQPALVIRYEAESEKELQRIRQTVEKALAKARRQVAG